MRDTGPPVLTTRPLTRGIFAPSSPVPPRFGGFLCPFPKISWCGFGKPSGFPRPSSLFSKYFLARGNFFLKTWCEFWQGSRAWLALSGEGVGRFLSPFLRSVGLSCGPVRQSERRQNGPPFLCPLSCPVINSALKMDYYTIQGGKMALRA